MSGSGSVIGTATGYALESTGIESRWGARFYAPVQTRPGAHPVSCTMSTGSFLGVKCGRGVTLTPQPILMPWSRKSRAIPLLPLWAVRPVQSLSTCTRVHFTLYLICTNCRSASCNFYNYSFFKTKTIRKSKLETSALKMVINLMNSNFRT